MDLYIIHTNITVKCVEKGEWEDLIEKKKKKISKYLNNN